MSKIKLAPDVKWFLSAANPLGLHIGQPIKAKRTCTVAYDVHGDKKLWFEDRARHGYIIGAIKRALGKYIKGHTRPITASYGRYEPARLKVSEYVRLYECRSRIDGKTFLVHPDDIETMED